MDSIKPIILAAGKGKRMRSELPKVLLPMRGKSLITHLLEALTPARVSKPATIIVGVESEQVKAACGPEYHYVLQSEQLGTGHAVLCAEKSLRGVAEHIMVLYGDHPLMNTETINRIAEAHLAKQSPITMATVPLEDFDGWRASFKDFGRIIRNAEGDVERIVETKDANEKELLITEVNPSYFCFRASWLWNALKLLDTDNAQGEYYLTALPEMARRHGEPITSVSIDPMTALGANTPEQLETLERLIEGY